LWRQWPRRPAEEASAAYLETARAFACSRSQILWKVIFPAAVPFFVSGLRLRLGRVLLGVAVAEMFTAMSGLGYMITTYAATFKTAYLFVPIPDARRSQHPAHGITPVAGEQNTSLEQDVTLIFT
jgi:ABC-type phosphate transport system permease subunit